MGRILFPNNLSLIPKEANNKNKLFSAIPSSICCPSGKYFHFCDEKTFFSPNISDFLWVLKIFFLLTHPPKLVETVTSGEVVIILLVKLFLTLPISFIILPNAS